MRRFFLVALAAGIVVLVVAALAVGVFPPRPVTHTVQKSVPASAFSAH